MMGRYLSRGEKSPGWAVRKTTMLCFLVLGSRGDSRTIDLGRKKTDLPDLVALAFMNSIIHTIFGCW
jgi:hypothetical protein